MLKNEEKIITEGIPLFPLGIVVFPGETRFLHVFETKYKNLFSDLNKFGNFFGIPFVSHGNVRDIGSLVKLEKVLTRYPNGELDVAVRGYDVFSVTRMISEHPERFYPYGDIFLLKKNSVNISKPLIDLFEKYSEKVLKLNLKKYPRLSFFIIANSIGLTDFEKYEILIQSDEKKMNKILTNHLRLREVLSYQLNSITDFYSLN